MILSLILLALLSLLHPNMSATVLEREKSYIHFQSAGQIRGISINGGISLEIDVKPYFISLYKTCEGFQKAAKANANLTDIEKRNIKMMLNTAFENCLSESRTITHTLSAWLSEKEILEHPLLNIEESIYGRGHHSMAAPLTHHVSHYGQDRYFTDQYRINERSKPKLQPMGREDYNNNLQDYNDDLDELSNHEEYEDFTTVNPSYGKREAEIPRPPKLQQEEPPSTTVRMKVPLPSLRPSMGSSWQTRISEDYLDDKWKEFQRPRATKAPTSPEPVTDWRSLRRPTEPTPADMDNYATEWLRLRNRTLPESPASEELVRNKRGFFGAAIGGILSVGEGILTGLGLGGVLNSIFPHDNSDANTHEALQDQRKINKLEQDEIARIEKNFAGIIRAFETSEGAIEAYHHVNHLKDRSLSVYMRNEILCGALTHLLHRKLSSQLVDPEALRMAFDEVKKNMLLRNAHPIFTSFLPLFGNSVHHRLDPVTLTFHIHLEVPGEIRGTGAVLVRLVRHPIQMYLNEEASKFVFPEVEEQYLAIGANANGTYHYRALNIEDLESCQTVDNTRLCRQMNVYRTDFTGKCLIALYHLGKGAGKEISEFCRVKVATETSIYQTGHNSFSIFLPSRKTIAVFCGSKEVHHQWEGLVRLELDEGCYASADGYTMYSTPVMKDSTVHVTKKELILEDIIESESLKKWHDLATSYENRSETGPNTFTTANQKFAEDIEASEHGYMFYITVSVSSLVSFFALMWLISRFITIPGITSARPCFNLCQCCGKPEPDEHEGRQSSTPPSSRRRRRVHDEPDPGYELGEVEGLMAPSDETGSRHESQV